MDRPVHPYCAIEGEIGDIVLKRVWFVSLTQAIGRPAVTLPAGPVPGGSNRSASGRRFSAMKGQNVSLDAVEGRGGRNAWHS